MSRRRAALLIALGILLGSLATGFAVWRAMRPATQETGGVLAEVGAVEEEGDNGTYGPMDGGDLSLDFRGSCVLTGTVRDDSGEPVAQALVGARALDSPWASASIPLETRTDSKGNFRLEGLAAGLALQLFAYASGRAVGSRAGVVCPETSEIILRGGGTLELTFLKPGEDPAGEVEILLGGGGLWPARSGSTEDGGEIVIVGLEPGEYVIWARAVGYAHVSIDPLVVEEGKKTVAEIVLDRAANARLSVLDGHGLPFEGEATVLHGPSASSLLRRAVFVDRRTGAAMLEGLAPAEYVAVVSAPGHVDAEPIAFRPGDATTASLVTGATITGVVRTVDGQPIPGASLSVNREMGASLVALPSARGRDFNRRVLREMADGFPRLRGLEGANVIAGPRVIPLPGDELALASGGDRAWQYSGKDGRFLLDALPSGRLEVHATHPQFFISEAAEVTLEQGGAVASVVVEMKRGSRLRVRTVDERGFPLRGVEIAVFDRDDAPVGGAASGADGFADLVGLPGSFRVESTAEERVSAYARVDGRTGAQHELELTMPLADQQLSGRLTDENGFGVEGAAVTAKAITRGLAQVLTTGTGDDGSFKLDGAGAGSYHVTADAGRRGRAQVPDAISGAEIKLVLGSGGAPILASDPGYLTPEEFSRKVGTPVHDEGAFAGDNLGTTGEGVAAAPVESVGTIETRFGAADALPVTGPPSGKGGLPISIGGGAGKVLVTQVQPGSRVSVAGLSVGDRIIAVDDKKVGGPAAARKAISGPIGSVVMLKVQSANGEVFNVVVQRVRVRAQ